MYSILTWNFSWPLTIFLEWLSYSSLYSRVFIVTKNYFFRADSKIILPKKLFLPCTIRACSVSSSLINPSTLYLLTSSLPPPPLFPYCLPTLPPPSLGDMHTCKLYRNGSVNYLIACRLLAIFLENLCMLCAILIRSLPYLYCGLKDYIF